MSRVKVSYTINGFNKLVVGTLILRDSEKTIVKSEKDGAVVTVKEHNIDEFIEYRGDEHEALGQD